MSSLFFKTAPKDNSPPITVKPAIACGGNHSLALKTDGTVVAWGKNDRGQCNVPIGLYNVIAIAGGNSFSAAVKSNGTVIIWGANDNPVQTQITDAIGIACGWRHVVILKRNQTVVAWANDETKPPEVIVPPNLQGVITVSASIYESAALLANGNIVIWGKTISSLYSLPSNSYSKMVLTATTLTITGPFSYISLGNLFGGFMGINKSGYIEPIMSLSSDKVNIIAFPDKYKLHGVYCNQPPRAPQPRPDITSAKFNTADNSTVLYKMCYEIKNTETPPPAVAIATGLSHGIILNTSGSIEGWGSNNYGEGTVSPALPSIIAIACGNSHSLVLTNTLQLLAWGLNTDLQTTIPVGLSISPVPTTNSLNSMIVGNTKAKKTTTSAVPEDTVDVKLLVIVIVSILVILIILIVSVYFIHYAFTKK